MVHHLGMTALTTFIGLALAPVVGVLSRPANPWRG